MCPNYFHTLYHNVCTSLHNCRIWECLYKRSDESHLKECEEEEDEEVLKFWVPQRSFSTQSVQSLTPSLKSLKRDSITSASTIAEEDNPLSPVKQRRHSDITRTLIGRSHEWPERLHKISSADYFLERTNSASSIRLSLYKDALKNAQTEKTVISEEGDISSSNSCANNVSEDENLMFGMLSFSTNYDQKRKRLTLHLDKANNLPQRGRKKTYDTLIKIHLIPKQSETNTRSSFASKDVIIVQSSRKVKNTLNPHFHEDFIFDIEKLEALKNFVLRLSLFDYERQGRFDAIGHIVLPLSCMTKSGESKKHNLPFRCQSSLDFNPNGPQLLVSLSYSSTTDKLTVGVLRTRRLLMKKSSFFTNLLKGTNSSKLETYVKVTLMCASNKIKSLKTNLVLAETDCDPVFNQTFSFVAPHGFMDEISVVISVCFKGKLKFDSVIGRVISGPIAFASNDKLTHWGKMVFGQERAITEWRNLYS